jgi:hypothetical protein
VRARSENVWLSRIEGEDAREAFHYVVGRAASLMSLTCHPQQKGVISDFRFIDTDRDEMPFAFIPNKHWLLFYFRAPAVRSAKYSLAAVAAAFDSAGENASGEWTIKLRSIADVRRLWQILSID